MYEKRNTIALLIAVIAIIGFGKIFSSRLETKHAKLAEKNRQLEQEFTESDNIARTLPEVQFKFDSLKARWINAPKKILALPEPQLTMSYMVWLARQYNLDLQFEFQIDEIRRADIISYFTFTISGESNYTDLYTFIYYMTQNPILYQFEKFALRRNENNRIEYEIQMRGFFLQEEILPEEQFNFAGRQAAAPVRDGFHDIFYTTYTPPRDDNDIDTTMTVAEVEVKSDLVDPSKASLLALTSNTAYILNEEGVMKRLSPGDRVEGGRLVFIDQEKSEAQFQLSDGQRIVLGLGYKK